MHHALISYFILLIIFIIPLHSGRCCKPGWQRQILRWKQGGEGGAVFYELVLKQLPTFLRCEVENMLKNK